MKGKLKKGGELEGESLWGRREGVSSRKGRQEQH